MELVIRPALGLRLFLAPRHRHAQFEVSYDGAASLGHVVQSLGIPLTEAGAATIDGVRSVPSVSPRPGAVIELEAPSRPQKLPHGAVDSPGVARMYSGTVGKAGDCQVEVSRSRFTALRVRPANRTIPRASDGSLPDSWLITEWPPERTRTQQLSPGLSCAQLTGGGRCS